MSNCFCIQLSVRHSIHGLCGWPECRSGCVPERPIRLRVVVRGVNLKREKNCVINKIQTDYAAGYYQTIHT